MKKIIDYSVIAKSIFSCKNENLSPIEQRKLASDIFIKEICNERNN